jgi:uncharacterized protein YndB with AHSA1/START domain
MTQLRNTKAQRKKRKKRKPNQDFSLCFLRWFCAFCVPGILIQCHCLGGEEVMTDERKNASAGNTTDREIVATRVFDAPRELMFKMWTEPEHIAQWWGPRGFTTTIYEMDVRPQGVWRFVMHGPDGADYQNKIVYLEIEGPERIVYDHVSGPRFQSTATFEDLGGKTRLTVRMVFESAELRDKVARDFGAVEGLNQTLERLGERLAKI